MNEYQLSSMLNTFRYRQYVNGCNDFFTAFRPHGTNFETAAGATIPYIADQMKLKDLYTLEDYLKSFSEESTKSRDEGQFFRGIIILYGLESTAGGNESIKLIYRPVYADISRIINSGGNYVLEFVFSSLVYTDEYYTWAADGWHSASATTVANWQKNYWDKIEISHDASGKLWTPFVFGMKDSDDARGVFFSFQEIRQFYKGADATVTDIFVTNIAEIDPKYSTYKHTIAFSDTVPGAPDPKVAISANFGTLYPPGTGSIMITNMISEKIAAENGLPDNSTAFAPSLKFASGRIEKFPSFAGGDYYRDNFKYENIGK